MNVSLQSSSGMTSSELKLLAIVMLKKIIKELFSRQGYHHAHLYSIITYMLR